MRKSAAQKRKRRSLYVKRRNKKAKSVLLVGVSALLLGAFFLIKSLITPAVSAYSSASSDLKDKDIYSFLLTRKETSGLIGATKLMVVQKTDHKVYSFDIPVTSKVDLPGRLGEEEISKILKIESSVNNDSGANLLVESVKKLAKFNVDRYLIAGPEAYKKAEDMLLHKDITGVLPWEMKNFAGEVETNFSWSEILDTVNYFRGMSDAEREEISTSEVADLDLKFRDITLSGDAAQESLGVVILNGTGVGNAGREVSQVAQNIGARISLVSNSENEYQKSYLITEDPMSPTVKYIKSYFPGINIISKDASASLGENLIDRGDITIIVGFDILEQVQ